ncbi:MAG: T9SS type A sorting domain-containing protein, partial [Ignavibacteria bacterium]|nr:T9SS type A sorting domain-containing protein [Ignavibacteria bacterium]
QAGYVELYNCYSEETAESIISYFSALPKEASSDLKLLLSYLYLKQGAAEKAKQVNEAIVATDENSDLSVKANLNNFYIALYTENDPDEAVDILLGMVDNTKLAKASESSVGEMSDAEYSLIQYSKIYDKQIPDLERLKQGIKTLAEGKPDKFELAQNFPNPFNPSTMISFQLPINGYVTLKIYDLLGQEIATLVNEQKSAGKYEVKFDASDLASGVYIYRIQAGEFNASKKLILLK